MKYRQKEPIRLRAKELKDGNKSLYLDCYISGKRSFEFLKLYLIPEATPWDKERNKATRMQAEAIKARRILEYQQGVYGTVQNSYVNRVNLSDYILKMHEKRKSTHSATHEDGCKQAARLIREYGDTTIQRADKRYFEGFISYMDKVSSRGKKLSGATKSARLAYVNTALNDAVREGLIPVNPLKRIDSRDKPQRDSPEVEYLTMDEVRRMGETVCRLGTVKRAFMFACFCGLRISDLRALRWQDIKNTPDGKQAEVRQQKTKNFIRVPLSENALRWLPEKMPGNDKVFALLPARNTTARTVKAWAADAGISKRVTFHCLRHTCATLLLTYGADIYTVSKILGHTDIKTTQVYAQVIDKRRAEAVSLIPEL